MLNEPPSSADQPTAARQAAASRASGRGEPVTIRSEELLQGQAEVLIAHGADTYRLRLTRSGKLILQK